MPRDRSNRERIAEMGTNPHGEITEGLGRAGGHPLANLYKRQREPDTQYRSRLEHILRFGELAKLTEQKVGAHTAFGTVPQMIFDLSNGVPLITERANVAWR